VKGSARDPVNMAREQSARNGGTAGTVISSRQADACEFRWYHEARLSSCGSRFFIFRAWLQASAQEQRTGRIQI